jgi:hypothetical protein
MSTSMPSRGKFSGYALMEALEEAQEAHADGRDLHPHLLNDWERYIDEQFELDDDQRADLNRLCSNPDEKIQQTVMRALSTSGETPRFTLERKSDGRATDSFVNELKMNRSRGLEATGPEAVDFTIAHCDADCLNWKWGPVKTEAATE